MGEGDLPFSGPERDLSPRLADPGLTDRGTDSVAAGVGPGDHRRQRRFSPLELYLDPGNQGRKYPGPVFGMVLAREDMGQFMA